MIDATMGFGYAGNKQMNDAVGGYGDYVAGELNTLNSTNVFSGNEDKAGFQYHLDLELRYLMSSFGFGASFGYHGGGKSESVAEADGYESKQSLSITLSATPVLGTLYYRQNLSDFFDLVFGIGAGYYNGQMVVKEEASGFVSGNFSNEYEYKGSTVGYHGKIELISKSSFYHFYAGILGRYAQIDEFKNGSTTLTVNGKKLEGNFTGATLYFGAGLNL
jgi:hypothetical protein